jgi:hypothetical protein
VYDVPPATWLRASTVWLKPTRVSATNGVLFAMPSKSTVRPLGTVSKLRFTFCG